MSRCPPGTTAQCPLPARLPAHPSGHAGDPTEGVGCSSRLVRRRASAGTSCHQVPRKTTDRALPPQPQGEQAQARGLGGGGGAAAAAEVLVLNHRREAAALCCINYCVSYFVRRLLHHPVIVFELSIVWDHPLYMAWGPGDYCVTCCTLVVLNVSYRPVYRLWGICFLHNCRSQYSCINLCDSIIIANPCM